MDYEIICNHRVINTFIFLLQIKIAHKYNADVKICIKLKMRFHLITILSHFYSPKQAIFLVCVKFYFHIQNNVSNLN
jgi:hypothetical protein